MADKPVPNSSAEDAFPPEVVDRFVVNFTGDALIKAAKEMKEDAPERKELSDAIYELKAAHQVEKDNGLSMPAYLIHRIGDGAGNGSGLLIEVAR